MPTVNIVKPFTFTHTFIRHPEDPDKVLHATTDDPLMHGKDEFVPVGVHDLSPEMADHWFVQAHSDKPPFTLPKPGTPEYGAYQARALRRRQMVEASIEQEAHLAANAVRSDALQSGRVAENEEQAQAEEAEVDKNVAEAAAANEAARAGRRVASPVLPQRRGAAAAEPPPAA